MAIDITTVYIQTTQMRVNSEGGKMVAQMVFADRPNPPAADGIFIPDEVEEPDRKDGIPVQCKVKVKIEGEEENCSFLSAVKISDVNCCPWHGSQRRPEWKRELEIKRIRKKFFP